MRKQHLVALVSGLLVSQLTLAAKGPPGGKNGRGENATGIVTVLTYELSVAEGLFSDEGILPGSNLRYYGAGLNGQEDPDNPGTLLDDGDCVVIVTPAADGVDNGKFVLFAPFGTTDCPDPGMLRQLAVLGSGEDLNGIDGSTDPELIDVRVGCNDVFPKDSPVATMGTTTTSCSLEVREYDQRGEFERTWIIEWASVQVTHLEADLRRIEPLVDAEIFELIAPLKGNGKKDKVSRGWKPLPFRFEIRRVTAP